ncbi:MAG: hypothetical protein ACK5XN_16680, partial [Bacteroidota bacterium]
LSRQYTVSACLLVYASSGTGVGAASDLSRKPPLVWTSLPLGSRSRWWYADGGTAVPPSAYLYTSKHHRGTTRNNTAPRGAASDAPYVIGMVIYVGALSDALTR